MISPGVVPLRVPAAEMRHHDGPAQEDRAVQGPGQPRIHRGLARELQRGQLGLLLPRQNLLRVRVRGELPQVHDPRVQAGVCGDREQVGRAALSIYIASIMSSL